MIEVKFSFSDDGKTIVLSSSGHADAAPRGEDTVCAAASILAYTVAQEITDLRTEGKLRRKPTVRLGPGSAVLTCKPTKGAYAEALHTFKVAQTGYRLLAANFPDHVRVHTFGEA